MVNNDQNSRRPGLCPGRPPFRHLVVLVDLRVRSGRGKRVACPLARLLDLDRRPGLFELLLDRLGLVLGDRPP